MLFAASPGTVLWPKRNLHSLGADYYDVDLTRLSNLPGTAEALRAAADIVGGNDSKLLVGRDYTESELKSKALNQFRILHLALDGKANAKNQDRTALIFLPMRTACLSQRILGLHLNPDLVVLSTCKTFAENRKTHRKRNSKKA